MRYVITPGKKPDPNDESGKKKVEYLTAQVWPGPWSIEHTAEEKIEAAEFEGNQAGLDAAVTWLHDRYHNEPGAWGKPALHSGLRARPISTPKPLAVAKQAGGFLYNKVKLM